MFLTIVTPLLNHKKPDSTYHRPLASVWKYQIRIIEYFYTSTSDILMSTIHKSQLKKFSPDKDFQVKDSKWMNYLISAILLTLAIVALIMGDMEWTNFIFAAVLLLAGVFFIIKAQKNKVSIVINRSGFYHHGKLIFQWNQYIDAKLTQDEKLASFQDNFIILIRHYSTDKKLIYTSKIPMSNTQDKADEEILAAIDFYNRNRSQAGGRGL